ncbi:hypothetical protein HBH56_024420 [Parastagonospora nodorum]|uniref:Uncharacterized protein n=2 Tax=Phaeosphaeria nodorum (strain SN15 / ATCC MYA-4574 / FGSC 10173) TaxID=321614 RepID=A0A7U2F6X4_PHANO|nr:hypothetical protein SNOG_06167 [Parastagonospora nodorum SN15]KAH3918760.1 hypothetical protein HBH56_024420 [Parastagonospora nodorum]EAT85998.1 hypothetical protein SNOG_06167 [Parastagonospora nodorum SN15]KAH3934252.1 hypothetical protein HBH54_057590 [Parastagonospora nodorum]KAH3975792.1 hypothetical protein HBH51_080080 [Parastagonospora nodorum]KAH3985284.1 hypothetical protein HBH52_056390 [Parastagonospora nodorum]
MEGHPFVQGENLAKYLFRYGRCNDHTSVWYGLEKRDHEMSIVPEPSGPNWGYFSGIKFFVESMHKEARDKEESDRRASANADAKAPKKGRRQ